MHLFFIVSTAILVTALSTSSVKVTYSIATAEKVDCTKEASAERWLSQYRTMPMNQVLMTFAMREACEVSTDSDIDALHSFHETRGCSKTTPFGEYIQSFVDGENVAKLQELVPSSLRVKGEKRDNLCSYVEALQLPKNIVPLVDMAPEAEEFWQRFRDVSSKVQR